MQIPGFLHNLDNFLFEHAEGMKNGVTDAAKFEASPLVQDTMQFAETAAKNYFLTQVAAKIGVEPTSEGLTGALTGLVDGTTILPADAKEPVKLLLGGLLAGSNFLAPSISLSPNTLTATGTGTVKSVVGTLAEGTEEIAKDLASKDSASKDLSPKEGETPDFFKTGEQSL